MNADRKNYGIYDWVVRPEDRVVLLSPRLMNWASMEDFSDVAKNHCGATMLTNYLLLLEESNTSDSVRTNIRHTSESALRRALFQSVHTYVPDGPIFRMSTRANRYFKKEEISARLLPIRAGELRSRLDEGHPCALLIARSLFHWHWVLVVGYVEKPDGTCAFAVVDEWHHQDVRLYEAGKGSRVLAAAVFLQPEGQACRTGA